jgi:mannosyltransferase OCH1-like enzyme
LIPRIIHQTWKEDEMPPAFAAWSKSWRGQNPEWRWILWTDRMLLDFAWQHYPALLPVFCSYESGIMRADAARYMLLHHFGGIYADLDTECVAPLSVLETEDRVVLCHEPPSHWGIRSRFAVIHFCSSTV